MAEELSSEELRRKLADGEEPQLIDVRQPEQFEGGHLPGAENVPMTHLPTRVEDMVFDEEVVVACQIGEASLQAVRLLRSFEGADGSEIWSLEGGMEQWDGEIEAGEGADA